MAKIEIIAETIDTEWPDDGQLKSVTDNSGTTTYHYDPITDALSGMDSPTGSLRYGYDVFGRLDKVGVKASPDANEAITKYRYDGNSNLVRIIDTNGETEMIYDEVNRLKTRTLPNGITTSYLYQDKTDWVESITHKAADGNVLSSVTYERNPDGTPHTITREDGTYVKLDYDDSLRLETETYYSAGGVIVDEIAYTYDSDGNRHTVSNGAVEGTYHYDNTTHQLSGITTSTGDESYLYDESGRVWKILRDGETLTLNYDAHDQLESITDADGNIVTQYTTDAEGRRIEVNDRDYLVAPMVGTDLNSPHLITDNNGDILSRYVYAGATPLMRFDENGDPIYYLTDAMGSVIGLADDSGASAATFHYDSFGNLRNTTGDAANELATTGGDFRFQSQWLESDTDLYHFRARYYDPEVGRFISRDPVDIIETVPESSNPYQFVYNNPMVNSDPTGEITITEINASEVVQKILNGIRQYSNKEIKDGVIDEIEKVATDFLINAVENIVPFINVGDNTLNRRPLSGTPSPFEVVITDTFCQAIRETLPTFFGLDYLWFQPHLSRNGTPTDPGINPSSHGDGCGIPFSQGGGSNKPELIVKRESPTDTSSPSYLLTEIKTDIRNVQIGSSSQFRVFLNYATKRGHMFIPAVLYVSLKEDSRKEKKLKDKAARAGAFLEVIDFGF